MTTFSNFFAEIAFQLNYFKWLGNVTGLVNILDITDNIVINKFRSHPSIRKIKNKFKKIIKFSFQQATLLDIKKATKDMRSEKP